MIIHRFVFTAPVQLPGKSPTTQYEPAAVGNIGHTVTRTATGWLFTGPAGALSGLSTSGREEMAALGMPEAEQQLSVEVPHGLAMVHYVGTGDLPTSAPSDVITERHRTRLIAPPPSPAADPAPDAVPPTPASAPAPARRRPLPAASPPPPSVGWVDDK